MEKRATAAKKSKRSARTVTLFFESRDDCIAACETLGLNKRKCVDIDKSHNGAYSKATGHYALMFKDGASRRISLRAKMSIEEEMYLGLSESVVATLRVCDCTGIGWIVS